MYNRFSNPNLFEYSPQVLYVKKTENVKLIGTTYLVQLRYNTFITVYEMLIAQIAKFLWLTVFDFQQILTSQSDFPSPVPCKRQKP